MNRQAEVSTIRGDGAPLAAHESARLEYLEGIVGRGLLTFVEVGNALVDIRDARLYRATHATFEEYCRDRWGMTRVHADRLILAAEVADDLKPIGFKPASEGQVRPLARVPREDRAAVMGLVVEATPPGQEVTGKAVRAAVDELVPPPSRRPPAPAPRPSPPRPLAATPAEPEAVDDALEAGIEPEPEDIARQRRGGYLGDAEKVIVTDTRRDADEEDEPPDGVQREQTDAEFLASLPLRDQLVGQCRTAFDHDALLFRELSGHRRAYEYHAKRALNATRLAARRAGADVGNYHVRTSMYLRNPHPRHWRLCAECKGTGKVSKLINGCPTCHDTGYHV